MSDTPERGLMGCDPFEGPADWRALYEELRASLKAAEEEKITLAEHLDAVVGLSAKEVLRANAAQAELSATKERLEAVREGLRRLLKYFGAPVGVSMQELGPDSYVELTLKVRLGDLMDARAILMGRE